MAPRRRRGQIPVIAVSGWSGSGKTRLLSRLVPALARRGISTAVVKHTLHPHPFDRPGKDTEVLRRAGAVATAIEGPHGMALFGPPAGGLRALVARLPLVDLVLAEGWKDEPIPRLEVHRRRVTREFLCARDRRVFAVVTDEPPPRGVQAFGPDDVDAVADLLAARLTRERPLRGTRAVAGGPRREQRSRGGKRAHGRAREN